MNEEIRVTAIAHAIAGQEAQVEAAMTACIAPTRAEPGCLFYGLHVDPARPGRFMFVERWAGEEALRRHTQTPHFQAMVAALGTITQGGLDVAQSAV